MSHPTRNALGSLQQEGNLLRSVRSNCTWHTFVPVRPAFSKRESCKGISLRSFLGSIFVTRSFIVGVFQLTLSVCWLFTERLMVVQLNWRTLVYQKHQVRLSGHFPSYHGLSFVWESLMAPLAGQHTGFFFCPGFRQL